MFFFTRQEMFKSFVLAVCSTKDLCQGDCCATRRGRKPSGHTLMSGLSSPFFLIQTSHGRRFNQPRTGGPALEMLADPAPLFSPCSQPNTWERCPLSLG